MNLLRLLPVVISAGMLGAHFMRAGAWGQVALCGILPVFLLVRVGLAGGLWASYGADRSPGALAAWPMVLAATTWASLMAERLMERTGRATVPQKGLAQ
jgi:hypothetical protein